MRLLTNFHKPFGEVWPHFERVQMGCKIHLVFSYILTHPIFMIFGKFLDASMLENAYNQLQVIPDCIHLMDEIQNF